jgi:cytoskeletal protein CcmA (bactofilin family)
MAKINSEKETNDINIIANGTKITGDINSNGDIRVDGSLTGKLITKGKLIIGETGKVKGEINCKNSDVEGSIEGKIIVAQLLALKAKARINGDIITNKLAIEPGCQFTGNCDMAAATAPSMKNLSKSNPQKSKPSTPSNYAMYTGIAFQMIPIILVGVFGGIKPLKILQQQLFIGSLFLI